MIYNDYFICDMIVEDENYCINDEFEQSYEELKDSSYKKFNN